MKLTFQALEFEPNQPQNLPPRHLKQVDMTRNTVVSLLNPPGAGRTKIQFLNLDILRNHLMERKEAMLLVWRYCVEQFKTQGTQLEQLSHDLTAVSSPYINLQSNPVVVQMRLGDMNEEENVWKDIFLKYSIVQTGIKELQMPKEFEEAVAPVSISAGGLMIFSKRNPVPDWVIVFPEMEDHIKQLEESKE